MKTDVLQTWGTVWFQLYKVLEDQNSQWSQKNHWLAEKRRNNRQRIGEIQGHETALHDATVGGTYHYTFFSAYFTLKSTGFEGERI